MKKISILPSFLVILTIMTLGLTSCSKKYGCYYTQGPEMKIHKEVDAIKGTSASGLQYSEDTIESPYYGYATANVAN